MDHLRTLVNLFKDDHPELKAREEMFKHMEDTLLPHLLRVIQKDATLLTEVELFPGVKVKWVDDDEHWQRLHLALMYSVLRGDPKEKFGKIFETIKTMMPGAGSSQIDELLNDEDTQSSLTEMLELIMNTRLISIVGDIMQSVSFDDLGFDFENPESLLETFRNPTESAALNTLMERAKTVLEDRVRSGKINQVELQRDIELIRAKFQSSFGKYINEQVLGVQGNTTGNTASQILSNHPDARRARMMARLQKKQKEKARK